MEPKLSSNAIAGLVTTFLCNYYGLENKANLLFVSSLPGSSHWTIGCKEQLANCASVLQHLGWRARCVWCTLVIPGLGR